jgi:hypothetical protein
MVKLLRRIINLFKKCKMAKINNITSYPISTPVTGSDIVIGSITGSGGDTANFLMSDISAYVLGNLPAPTLQSVCDVASSTTTTMTVADTLTLSKASGTGLAVTANATIGGRLTITGTGLGNGLVVSGDGSVGGTLGVVGITTLTGALDANSTADIADTLTLSKATGTGLQVDANANIDGSLTVNSVAVFTDAGSSISAAGLISTAGNILALGDVGVGGTLGVVGITTLTGALDANSTADIADTLTLSKATGTGLQVTSNANILGNLTVDDISSQIGNPLTISAGGSLAATVNTFARYTFEYGITTTSGVSVLDGVRLVNTPPASSVASGIAGDLAVDATYIYVCVGANSWGRVAIDTAPF